MKYFSFTQLVIARSGISPQSASAGVQLRLERQTYGPKSRSRHYLIVSNSSGSLSRLADHANKIRTNIVGTPKGLENALALAKSALIDLEVHIIYTMDMLSAVCAILPRCHSLCWRGSRAIPHENKYDDWRCQPLPYLRSLELICRDHDPYDIIFTALLDSVERTSLNLRSPNFEVAPSGLNRISFRPSIQARVQEFTYKNVRAATRARLFLDPSKVTRVDLTYDLFHR